MTTHNFKDIFRQAVRISRRIESPVMRRKFRYNFREMAQFYNDYYDPSTTPKVLSQAQLALQSLDHILTHSPTHLVQQIFKPLCHESNQQ